MRLRSFLLAASIALIACSSEEPRGGGEDGIVENVPGSLVITSPARGAFIDEQSGPVIVRGTGATKALTIDGTPAKVAPDGSFEAVIEPKRGLNLVLAVDGESRLESPFLYGKFLPADRPVEKAIAIDIGSQGLSAPAPAASLTTIVNLALRDRDLFSAIRGQTFTGNALGATWSFAVEDGSHAQVTTALASADRGPSIAASAKNVEVKGTMTLGELTRPVTIRSSEAKIDGVVELSVHDGVLGAAMPSANVDLSGFEIDSGNGTIDTVVSVAVRPVVEKAIADAIKRELPNALRLTLDGVGLPKELDVSAMGLALKIPIATKFESTTFDAMGGTLTVSTLFGGTPAPNAPGWLSLGGSFTPGAGRPTAFGVSFSVDAVNQLFFAAWATGTLSLTAQGMKLTPELPPIVVIDGAGTLEVGFGEVLVTREGQPEPMCAVSILQKIDGAIEGDTFVLTPKGEPQIAITWLVGQGGGILDAIAQGAREQLTRVLRPFRFPLPKLSLEKLGPAFAGQSLAVTEARIDVDRKGGRVAASGAMAIVQ